MDFQRSASGNFVRGRARGFRMVFRLLVRAFDSLRGRKPGSDEAAPHDQSCSGEVEGKDDLPELGLRGLRKKDWVKDGLVSTEAFVPDKNTAEKRADRGMETSVNWEDHDDLLSQTMRHSSASHGVARFKVA